MEEAAGHLHAALWSWDPGALQAAVRCLDVQLQNAGSYSRYFWEISTAIAIANGKLALVHISKPQSVHKFSSRTLNTFEYWQRLDARAALSSPVLLLSQAQALIAKHAFSSSIDDCTPCLVPLQNAFARADMLDIDIYIEYCRGLLRYAKATDAVPKNGGLTGTALGQACSLLFCLLEHYSVLVPVALPPYCEARDTSTHVGVLTGVEADVALSFAKAMHATHRLSPTAAPATVALQRCALLSHVPPGEKHALLSYVLLVMTGHVLWAAVSRGVTMHAIRSEGLRLLIHLASSQARAALPSTLPSPRQSWAQAAQEAEGMWKLCLACFSAALDMAPEPAQQAEMALVLHDATVEYLTAFATLDVGGKAMGRAGQAGSTGARDSVDKAVMGLAEGGEDDDVCDAPSSTDLSSISTLTAVHGSDSSSVSSSTFGLDALDMSSASSSASAASMMEGVLPPSLLHASCSAPPSPVQPSASVCTQDSARDVQAASMDAGMGMGGCGDLLASMLVPPPSVLASHHSEGPNELALSLAQANVARLRQAASALGLQEVNGFLQGEGPPTPLPGRETVGSPIGEGMAGLHLVAFSPVGSGLLLYEGVGSAPAVSAQAGPADGGEGSQHSTSPLPTGGIRGLATKKRRRNQRSASSCDESGAPCTPITQEALANIVDSAQDGSTGGGGHSRASTAVHNASSPKSARRQEAGDTTLSPLHPAAVRGTADECSQLAARSSPARPPPPMASTGSSTSSGHMSSAFLNGPGSPDRRTAFRAHAGVGMSPDRVDHARAGVSSSACKYPATPARPRAGLGRGARQGRPGAEDGIDSDEGETMGDSDETTNSGPASSQQEELVQFTSGLTIQSPPPKGTASMAVDGHAGTAPGGYDSGSDDDLPVLRSVASWVSSSGPMPSPSLTSLLAAGRVHWSKEVLAVEMDRRAARQASMDESMMAQATDYSSIFSLPPIATDTASWPFSAASSLESASAGPGSHSPGSLPSASPREAMQRSSSLVSPYGSLAVASSPIPPAAAPPDQSRAERLPGAWPVTIPSQRCWPMNPPKYSPLSPAYAHRLWWIYCGGRQEAVKPLCTHGLLLDEEWDLLAVALKRAHAAAVTELKLQRALAGRCA